MSAQEQATTTKNTKKTHADPCVSLIVAAYNAQDTIERALRSALEDPAVAEIIVVDDCSADKTTDIVRSVADTDKRIKLIAQQINTGPAAARNAALSVCQNEWVGVLDADDFLDGHRISALLNYADGYDMIADDMYQVEEADISGPRETLLHPPLLEPKRVDLYDFVISNVTKPGRERGELGFIKPLIRTSFIQQHKLRYKEHMRLGEDYDLYVRLLALGARLILCPAQGYVSVKRPNSLSGQHSKEDLKALRDCNNDILKTMQITPKERKALRAHYRSVNCRYQWRCLIDGVKDKDIATCVKTFLRPYPVPFYLCGKLWEQVKIRVLKI